MTANPFNRTQLLILTILLAATTATAMQLVQLCGWGPVARCLVITPLWCGFVCRRSSVRSAGGHAFAALALAIALAAVCSAHATHSFADGLVWGAISWLLGVSATIVIHARIKAAEFPAGEISLQHAVSENVPPHAVAVIQPSVHIALETDFEDEELDELSDIDDVSSETESWTRQVSAVDDRMEIQLAVRFAREERQVYTHIPFIPNFVREPVVHGVALEGNVTIEVDRVYRFGVRLKVRRSGAVTSPERCLIAMQVTGIAIAMRAA